MNDKTDFRLKLEKPKVFIDLMQILGKLLDYADFSISQKMLELRAMDGAHVVQVHLQLPKDFFNEYKVEQRQKVRIDLGELNAVLKRDRGDVLYLMDSKADNKFLIQFQGDMKRNFMINLIYDSEADESPELEMDWKANVGLLAGDLANIVGDAHLAGDYADFTLTIDIAGDFLSIDIPASKSGWGFNANLKNFTDKPLAAGNKQSSLYSLEYLSDIAKSENVASNVSLKFASDLPMQLEYALESEGLLTFILAPRIETEESEEPLEVSKSRIEPFPEDSDDANADLEDNEGSKEDEEITDDD